MGTHELKDTHPVWAEIDLDCVRHNVGVIRSRLEGRSSLLAVVKANGYGHGDVQVARAAIAAGAAWLGIARVDEGRRLREAGIDAPILLLSEPPADSLEEVVSLDLTPSVYTEEFVSALARQRSKPLPVHVKIDTGMHRYGIDPSSVKELFDHLDRSGVEVGGVWSHLALGEDSADPYTRRQFETFMESVELLGGRAHGLMKHLCNSGGTFTFPDGHLDMVRCGISIYGIAPGPTHRGALGLRPALSFKARVGAVKRLSQGERISYGLTYVLDRDTSVATIQSGYADGYSRALSNNGHVLIGGKRRRVIGTITMDHFLADTGEDDVRVGDETVMIGHQGEEVVTADEVADSLKTIAYEILCGVGARVPRIYLNE